MSERKPVFRERRETDESIASRIRNDWDPFEGVLMGWDDERFSDDGPECVLYEGPHTDHGKRFTLADVAKEKTEQQH